MRQMVFPDVISPPWTVTGGAERETVLPNWEWLDHHHVLRGYYNLHAQIWPDDWWAGGWDLEVGMPFEIVTTINVLFEPPTPKTIDIHLENPVSTPDHTPVVVHEGINVITTKGVWQEFNGSYILTAASLDPTNLCQIHFTIDRVEINF